ncbi:MAG: TRAP transporter substrate-binding protein DctP [Dehalococcoidales bacterium]|nr:TRAP transporter substrate-binding protein DctP [Dehalococcoidales bacterium]
MKKSKGLLKLIAGVSLVAVLAVSIPMISGCTTPGPTTPEPTPTPTPGEPTPTPTPEPAEEGQTWHLRGISPQGASIVQRDSIEQCCDIITALSGGRVTFDWYAGGQIMPSEEEIPALKAGTIDMLQWYPLMGTATELRTIECGAPFATKNAVEFRVLIYHRGLMDLFAQSYEDQGLVYIGPSLHDPLEICSAKPAYSLEDMKGQRIQLLAEHAYPYEQVGVACMPTPPADVYLAIQTGAMDGFGWSGADEIVQFGNNEVAPYLWDPPFVDVCNVAYLINPDVWATMPDDIRQCIKEGVMHLDVWNETIRAHGEYKYRTDGSFQEICFLPEEEIEVLRQHGMDYLDIVAQRDALCAQAVQIIKDFRAEVEEARWYGH